MIRIFINQKKNNLFFNIFNGKRSKIFYNSIGLEGYVGGKNISYSKIEFLIFVMIDYLNYFLKKKFFISNKNIYLFKNGKKIKIKIFIFLNILNNFNYFLTPIIENFNYIKINYYKIIFLNKFPHGGCNFKKSKYSNR